MKCAILKDHEAEWAWQPFGPDPDPLGTFAELGWHYRGFPVIKISDEAKRRIQAGECLHFVYHGQIYATKKDGVYQLV